MKPGGNFWGFWLHSLSPRGCALDEIGKKVKYWKKLCYIWSFRWNFIDCFNIRIVNFEILNICKTFYKIPYSYMSNWVGSGAARNLWLCSSLPSICLSPGFRTCEIYHGFRKVSFQGFENAFRKAKQTFAEESLAGELIEDYKKKSGYLNL